MINENIKNEAYRIYIKKMEYMERYYINKPDVIEYSKFNKNYCGENYNICYQEAKKVILRKKKLEKILT